MGSRQWFQLSTLLSIAGSAVLILWEGFVHSPNLDEVAHLPAGCVIVGFGSFSLYEVNPPFVKSLAAIPAVLMVPKYDWSRYSTEPGARSEWLVGRDFVGANGNRTFMLFVFGRWMLLPIWVLAAMCVWRWSRDLGGDAAGFASTVCWCFAPEVIGWTATICPDSSAASMGVIGLWTYRSWLSDNHWARATLAGLALGLVLLTKTSWIILLPLFPLLALVHSHCRSWKVVRQLGLMGLTALYVTNSGYGFDRSFTKLGDFSFFTRTLAGPDANGLLRKRIPSEAGNRFAGTWLGEIPVPLPASFVEGLDLQKYDFEQGKWCYLRGEHKFGGWWYWYAYALLIKTPTGFLLLGVIAVVLKLGLQSAMAAHSVEMERQSCSPSAKISNAGETATSLSPVLHEQLILLIPAICLFSLVSSQTGFSRYLRYVLPCYPFVFIFIGQVFSDRIQIASWLRGVTWGLLGWGVFSSLAVFPHSISYFNEWVGGPENGPAHLIDASIDWGQDVLFLADWCKQHPETLPLYSSVHGSFDPQVAGIQYEAPPADPRCGKKQQFQTNVLTGPQPGWYAVSVHHLYSRTKEFAYLFDFPKTDMVGYSIYIYHLTSDDVSKWNTEHRNEFSVETEIGADEEIGRSAK